MKACYILREGLSQNESDDNAASGMLRTQIKSDLHS
jgi:hypothetical protein